MIVWLLRQIPSVALCAWGVVVFILAGNKVRASWMIGVASEFAWAAYAVWIKQYGLLVGCIFYAIVYWRNWIRWGREQ